MSGHQAMCHFYIPASGAEDWRKLLADPGKHWRSGFSARSLAYAWETAKGFPPEVLELFTNSGVPAFQSIELLLAIPEHKVFMPPYGGHPSQNDLFALARDGKGDLIAISIAPSHNICHRRGATLQRAERRNGRPFVQSK